MTRQDHKGPRATRLQLMLTADEISAVDSWRFSNRMPSRSAAVRALIKLGFEVAPSDATTATAIDGVSSSSVGILDTDERVDAAMHGDSEHPVLVVGIDLLMAHAMKSILEAGGHNIVGPAVTPDEVRDLAKSRSVAAVVLVLPKDGSDPTGCVRAVAKSGLPVLVCAESNPSEDLPDSLRAAPMVSYLSAPEALSSSVTDLLECMDTDGG